MNTTEKRRFSDYADPFWGNGPTRSPAAEGMARNWNWLKAQTGNTHPGALLPCGWLSAVPYSGAYSSGYGTNGVSSCGPTPKALERKYAWGVSHFHTSGVGFIGYFYNYFLVTAALPGKNTEKYSELDDEKASPGYYSGKFTSYGSSVELTAGKFAAFHRWHFDGDEGIISLDLKQMGLSNEILHGRSKDFINHVSTEKSGSNCWCGTVSAHNVPICYAVKFCGEITSAAEADGKITVRCAGSSADVILACSMVSVEEALSRLDDAAATGFDTARTVAAAEWEKRLSRIRVELPSESETRIFYSALYHSLVKPCDTGREFIDFQTMWDVYRTQLPLVMAICPDIAGKMAISLMETIEKFGFFPNGYLMTDDYHHDDNQATALIIYSLCDAYNRGYIKDYARLKKVMELEFANADISKRSPTHKLDLAGALRAAAEVAKLNNDCGFAGKLLKESEVWKSAYDPDTGLLVEDAVYYEGTHWNYSFRPHTQMKERIELAGGTAGFNTLLDRFFGADCPPETAPGERSMIDNRFEGMNNESDMETPYCYLWAGRSDRLAEVCELVRRCRFDEGDGGCPGNNDSGGLSSWYVWCVTGIYPYAGSRYYLLGSPSVERAEIDFAGGTLKIEVERESSDSIYPESYEFNGEKFVEPWISLEKIEKGGVLKFHLTDRPGKSSPIPQWL